MERRTFLASLIATAVLDSERLLWVPGRKTISIPAPAREWVWINLRETRASGFFSNGGRYPGDVVDFLPVDELDGICLRAFADFKKFCVQTFGAYTPQTIDVNPQTRKWPKVMLLPRIDESDLKPGSGVWVSAFQKAAW